MSNQQMTVVGGGLVGAAIAYGAARAGLRVRVLDGGDVAFRASRGNFGLVWVSSKGPKMPRYARWSRDAAKLWPALHEELQNLTGVDSGLQQPGGFWLGFSDADVKARAILLEKIDREVGDIPFQMMSPSELRQYLPGLGPAVVGGSYCPLDGHANPLMLLRGLYAGLRQRGADVITGVDVTDVRYDPGNGVFEAIASDGQSWKSDRLVLAAGLGNARLSPQVGLHAPVTSTRGQVLISERLKPFLNYPTNKLRQTREGSVQIGSTSEDVGLDDGTTTEKIEGLARRAVATFPALARARLVRAWGALRPLTPDGYPIYQASSSCPGAYVATSHSGVSLAAAHSLVIGPWMGGLTEAPPDFDVFKGDRFSDPNAKFSHDH
ncbi:NAD(P)/FAD-dependent oxidoreductase [Microvirga mediterraneensis]|jgi:glycine/D-amino acid oxidase-like deaminating enzyme|uniref:FAD-binding oxidoreductase n=1 Tax=Microvirga mediterraneensis TaxID=2754695 RepID=A0A838BVZ4_9HYPH|nr:FAD-dependent oxidoreductase [Microvirga mediterraneensis]MBA1159272.1 FAD-binding oxidoreductase [Microvirga mediterraneensis]